MFLALQYVVFHRWKTLVLVGCIALTAFMPILLGILLREFDHRIGERSASTPLLVGPKGSGVDLTLHSLYFSEPPQDSVPYGECKAIRETALAKAYPINCRHTAKGFAVVGSTLDYLEFRETWLAEGGRTFAMLGECVIGSEVAKQTKLGVGDKILTDRDNLVDIAGLYPLRLKIVGVLKPKGTADDRAVFVDLNTSWVIDGLGHGHEDLTKVEDEGKILSKDDENIVALSSVLPFLEISAENAHLVHFHGNRDEFPLSAIIAIAPDEKSETLLIGRYQGSEERFQILVPKDVIRQLMGLVFQISQVFNASMALVGISTALLLALVVALSLRLREGEMQTMFRLGCSRTVIFQLQVAELIIVFVLSGILLVTLVAISYTFAGQFLERLIVN